MDEDFVDNPHDEGCDDKESTTKLEGRQDKGEAAPDDGQNQEVGRCRCRIQVGIS